ncbi:MAG TPA: extracellular solute-binding protein [Candidatus Binatia bacterium]|jgi:iron(III) transport system substrate-binding protein
MNRNQWKIAWILFVVAFLPARFDAIGAEVKPGGDAEWTKRVAAAKKEGKLSVFLFQRDNIEAAVKSFEKAFPEIQVLTASASAPETGPRIMAERRAEKYLWDLCICGPTTPYAVLYPAKALDAVKPALMLPEVVDESKWWGGKHHYMDPDGQHIFVFLGSVEMPNLYYNKNLVDPKEMRSFWDLTNAKWRGKILAMDPRQPGRQRVSARFLYHIPELGAPFLARLFTEMDASLSRDDRQAMDWLATGKFPLCLFCGDIDKARAQGLPVGEFSTYTWKESPAIYSGSNGTVALMNNAPHPNAARVFINWLLSREGQTNFQKVMNTPDVVMESMRQDIGKDPIAPERRRAPGVKYILMDTPERSDQAPVAKLLKEIIK